MPIEEQWSEPVFKIISTVIDKGSIRCEAIQSHRYVGINVIEGRRTAICRIYLQKKDKEIGLLDDKRVETKYPMSSIADINKYEKEIRKYAHIVKMYCAI